VACALRGISYAARTQPHFRAHLAIAAAAALVTIEVDLSPAEMGVLVATIGLVLAAELMNTAVEMLTDRIYPQVDTRAAAVKDVSAAAVLLASVCAAFVGVFLFLPHLVPVAHPLTRGIPAILAVILFAAFLAGALRTLR
jgi:diacylglycerol kinase (ATP)